jgi:hypothetical protein
MLIMLDSLISEYLDDRGARISHDEWFAMTNHPRRDPSAKIVRSMR